MIIITDNNNPIDIDEIIFNPNLYEIIVDIIKTPMGINVNA